MKKIYLFMTILLIIFVSACDNKKKENNENNNSNSNNNSNTNIKSNITSNINIVTSLEDTITNDTAWCGTFNLVWNDLKENYVKQDIIINPKKEIVTNLNKSTFSKKYLNENSYYTKFGYQTPELKKEIEENIKKKFNQNSDILDLFEWKENSKDNFIYAMLYKKFTFATPFNQLTNTKFNNNGEYRYFGIDKNKKDGINQVEVLFYDDYNNYAVKLITKENDEIILLKNKNTENNFLNIYKNIINKSNSYKGNKSLDSDDTLLVPYIKFNTLKEFKELEGLVSHYADGTEFVIDKALQTIKMQLNESGGDIKSEAAISTKETAAFEPTKSPRYFNFNSTFTIFLKEKDMELPYFAAYINDLSLFQKNDN